MSRRMMWRGVGGETEEKMCVRCVSGGWVQCVQRDSRGRLLSLFLIQQLQMFGGARSVVLFSEYMIPGLHYGVAQCDLFRLSLANPDISR